MHHLLVHTNQKWRLIKDNDSTERTTKYLSKINPTVKSFWALPQLKHKILNLTSFIKSDV